MKSVFIVLCSLLVLSCNSVKKEKLVEVEDDSFDYPEYDTLGKHRLVLKSFLDSISELDVKTLIPQNRESDSIFRSMKKVNKLISQKDFGIIKKALETNKILSSKVYKLFGEKGFLENDNTSDTIHFHSYFPTEKKDVTKEFVVSVDWNGQNGYKWFYFFRGNRLLSKVKIRYYFEVGLKLYRNEGGRVICCFPQNQAYGSSLKWDNYNFYLFDDNDLKPVLNELMLVHFYYPLDPKKELDSKIISYVPLKIEMTYNSFYYNFHQDTVKSYSQGIDTLEYKWDKLSKQYVCVNDSVFPYEKRLTYELEENNHLFLHQHAKELNKMLLSEDSLYVLHCIYANQ